MTALTLNAEFVTMRHRFRRTLAFSVALHAALLLLVAAVRDLAPAPDDIIEITWLEQAVAEPVLPEPAARPEPEPVPAAKSEAPPERVEPTLTVKQKLARAGAERGAVRDRLADLDPSPVARHTTALADASPHRADAAHATMAPVVRTGTPANLDRGPAPQRPAVALNRGPTSSARATAVAADVPTAGAGGGQAAPARPGTGASPAVRDLGGATLTGLVADRRVVHHVMPVYPEWAKDQAIEATVTVQFVVLPDGTVMRGVRVDKTGGFQDFDEAATAAIRQWRFAPLAGGEAREQWGAITFRYRLHD